MCDAESTETISKITSLAFAKIGAEFLNMISDLEQLLGCRVDLLERESVENMENWIKRKSILRCTETIYAVKV